MYYETWNLRNVQEHTDIEGQSRRMQATPGSDQENSNFVIAETRAIRTSAAWRHGLNQNYPKDDVAILLKKVPCFFYFVYVWGKTPSFDVPSFFAFLLILIFLSVFHNSYLNIHSYFSTLSKNIFIYDYFQNCCLCNFWIFITYVNTMRCVKITIAFCRNLCYSMSIYGNQAILTRSNAWAILPSGPHDS